MKKIAVTQRLVKDEKTSEIRDALDSRLAEFLSRSGYLPVLLPGRCDFKPYFDLLGIEGILLSGGNDISSVTDDALSKQRDKFERKLIEFAIRKNIPVFGICRGMQIIADYFRGKPVKIKGHAGTEHGLKISDGSKLKSDLKRLTAVNSFHNYGVKNIPEDFIISAYSEDGVIEAIEHKRYNIFGQMWHPERNSPFRKQDIRIIKRFFG